MPESVPLASVRVGPGGRRGLIMPASCSTSVANARMSVETFLRVVGQLQLQIKAACVLSRSLCRAFWSAAVARPSVYLETHEFPAWPLTVHNVLTCPVRSSIWQR